MKKIFFLFFTFSFSFMIAQNFQWAKQIGGSNYDNVNSVVTNNDGSIITIGSFQGTIDIDPSSGVTNLVSYGGGDLFFVKLDSLGGVVWYGQIGGAGNENAFSMTTDIFGNIFVVGSFTGISDMDPTLGVYNISPTSGSSSAFVSKIDSLGNLIWVKQIGSSNCAFNDITISQSLSIYLTGYYLNTIDFDFGPSIYNMTSFSSGVYDCFVMKLDNDGNFVWVRQQGGTGDDRGEDIIVTNSDEIVVSGDFHGIADFNPSSGGYFLGAVGTNTDLFVLKLDTLGNFIWAKNFGGSGIDVIYGLAGDSQSNLYFTGSFQGTADFNPVDTLIYSLVSSGGDDIYVTKITNDGDFVWAKQIGGTGGERAHDLEIDAWDFLYIGGTFQGAVDFDLSLAINQISSNSGSFDGFVLKLTKNGDFVWVRSIGGSLYDLGAEISLNNSGDVFLAGYFQGVATFDSVSIYNLTSYGSWDAFVAKWSQNVCSNIYFSIDSVHDLTCSLLGYASGQAVGAISPLQYSWSTSPVTNSNQAFIYSSGLFSLTVNDNNGCVASTNILVFGPDTVSTFELNSNLIATNFRPGRASSIQLDAFNDGCIPTTGNVLVVLDTMVNYLSASPIPDNIIGDTLIWNFTNLTYDSVHITPQIAVYTPTWATIGDAVCLKTIISPLVGDIDTTNNIKQYYFPVINSYDPNDKKVHPEGLCAEGYVQNDQLLTYTVRFQNTGNASAIDVYVLDTLDADLNLNSVRIIGNSHPLITEVLPGNVLKFRFDNINLADSTSNEAESHGYVIFEVLPNNGLSNGTAITNNVGIYFDYNPPVYTNTVLNTISDGSINTNVSTTGNTIIASLAGVNYQWLNCDNGNSIIVGATNQSYTAVASGNYAVIINDGCFIDTSACTLLTVIGISEVENNNQFSFYPNPSNNTITITTNESTSIKIINMLGEVVLEKQVQNNSIIDINNLSNGIYFIQTKEGYSTKLIKN